MSELKDQKTLMGQTVEEMLIELYTWYHKQGEVAREKKDYYKIGKMDGAVEAIEAVLLQVVGGVRLYAIWEARVNDKLLKDVEAYVEEHYVPEEESISRQ